MESRLSEYIRIYEEYCLDKDIGKGRLVECLETLKILIFIRDANLDQYVLFIKELLLEK